MSRWIRRNMLAKDAGIGRRITRTAGGNIGANRLVKLSGTDVVVADTGSTDIYGVSVETSAKISTETLVVAVDSEVDCYADVSMNSGEPAKAYNDGSVGPFLDSTFVGDTIKSGVGLSFTNQPANDGVEIGSDSALDIGTIRIWGTTNGGVTVVKEDIVLTGVTFVSSVKVDWGVILGYEVIAGGPVIGTITLREASGNAAISTMAAGLVSKGILSIASDAARLFLRIPTGVAAGASTKILGIVGTDEAGDEVKQALTLNGTTTVSFTTAMRTASKLLVGDVASSSTVTAKLPTIPDSELLKVGYVTEDIAAGDTGELVFDNKKVIVAAQMPVNGRLTKKFIYDFAVGGGAVNPQNLPDDSGAVAVIPADACIISAHYEVITALTSGGAATVAMGYTTAASGFLAATAYDDGVLVIDTFAAANVNPPIKVTAASSIIFTIGGATLTAGKVAIYVDYYQGS